MLLTRLMATAYNIENETGSGDRPLIAVVDDDASFLRSVGRLLDSAGYGVKMFGSGKEFLDALSEVEPRCAVLDVHMPGMTGLELLEQLAAIGSPFPAILVTAHDTPLTRERARNSGSAGFLLKPFDKQNLLAAIGSALSSRSATPAAVRPLSPPRSPPVEH